MTPTEGQTTTIDHGCSCGRPECRYDKEWGNPLRETPTPQSTTPSGAHSAEPTRYGDGSTYWLDDLNKAQREHAERGGGFDNQTRLSRILVYVDALITREAALIARNAELESQNDEILARNVELDAAMGALEAERQVTDEMVKAAVKASRKGWYQDSFAQMHAALTAARARTPAATTKENGND